MLSHPSLFLPGLTAALELDTVTAVHDTIADSIGQGGIPDDSMPFVYRNLGYDDR